MATIPLQFSGVENTLPPTTASSTDVAPADFLAGAIPHDGALRPIPVEAKHATILNDDVYAAVARHVVPPNADNLILATANADGTFSLGVIATDDTDETHIRAYVMDGNVVAKFPSPPSVTPIGRVLAINTQEDGLTYAILRDNGYIYLGAKPPMPLIGFGLKLEEIVKASTSVDGLDLGVMNDLGGSDEWASLSREGATENDPFFVGLQADGRERLNNAILGLVNATAAEHATSKGLFWQPFMVRYALRLYDGTHIMASSPVYMPVALHAPDVMATVRYRHNRDESTRLYSYFLKGSAALSMPCLALEVQLLDAVAPRLERWRDIVTHIDIFITDALYTYDTKQGVENIAAAKMEPSLAITSRPAFLANTAADSRHIWRSNEYPCAVSDWDRRVLFSEPKSFKTMVGGVTAFHRYASIPLERVLDASVNAGLSLDIDDTDLTALTARATLADDAASHCRNYPDVVTTYNQRLIAAAGARSLPAIPEWRTMTPLDDSGNDAGTCRILVKSHRDGREYTYASTGYSPWRNERPSWVFIPDADATEMTLYHTSRRNALTYAITLPLTRHDFLDGAFYAVDNPVVNSIGNGMSCSTPVYPSMPRVNDVSAVRPSEVGNPFVFATRHACAVGASAVKALAAATEAISQGQFGQHPLYAFTADGIWALAVASDGTFSASQPLCRDVVVGANAVLPLAQSVLFVAPRGVMQLAGANVTSLSEALDGNVAFAPISMHLDVSPLTDDTPRPGTLHFPSTLRNFLMGDIALAYDYARSLVHVFNGNCRYSWVLSLQSGAWAMSPHTHAHVVNAYPDTFFGDNVQDRYILSRCSLARSASQPMLYVSRPLAFGNPAALKTITGVQALADAADVNLAVYASHDLVNWRRLAGPSRGKRLRGIAGTPHRWLRIVVSGALVPNASLSSLWVDLHTRFTDKTRL